MRSADWPLSRLTTVPRYRALPGDASEFVSQSVPHGQLLRPGALFLETWRIRNVGTVVWEGRGLERQGPKTGPGLISSLRYIAMPDTAPGKVATVYVPLKAPTYDCSSIAYFKMVNDDGQLSFPDKYQLGLDVLVTVRGQLPDQPPVPDNIPTP